MAENHQRILSPVKPNRVKTCLPQGASNGALRGSLRWCPLTSRGGVRSLLRRDQHPGRVQDSACKISQESFSWLGPPVPSPKKCKNWAIQTQTKTKPEQTDIQHREQGSAHRGLDAAAGMGSECNWKHCHAVCHLHTLFWWQQHPCRYHCDPTPMDNWERERNTW